MVSNVHGGPARLHLIRIALVLVVVSIITLDGLRLVSNTNDPNKDFVIFPVTTRAALAGVNPYLPLPELAKLFQPDVLLERLPHPTPYPPPALFIGLPLVPLTYKQGIVVWLIFGILCLASSLLLLYRVTGSRKVIGVALLLFVTWHPVFLDLGYAQVMIPILFLTTLLWISLRSGRERTAGVLLGLLLALKLFAWPLALFLLIRKRWVPLFIAVGVFLLANALAALWIGPDVLARYYLHVGREVGELHRYDVGNFSPFTIGNRLFEGREGAGITVYPIAYVSSLARPTSVVCVVSIFLLGMYCALKAQNFDAAFAALVCLSLIINPVAWLNYLVLLAIPTVVIATRFITREITKREVIGIGALVLFALPMGHVYVIIERLLATRTDQLYIPAAGGLLGLAPLVFLVAVMVVGANDRSDKPRGGRAMQPP